MRLYHVSTDKSICGRLAVQDFAGREGSIFHNCGIKLQILPQTAFVQGSRIGAYIETKGGPFMKIEAHLVEIQNQRTLTKAQDPDFFYVLQGAMLLALQERGTLTEMQCRYAMEQLKAQYHNAGRKEPEERVGAEEVVCSPRGKADDPGP